MVTRDEVIKWALAFAESVQQPHFEKTSFRVNKKIFATLDVKLQRVAVKLNAIDQSVFCDTNPGVIYPVQGGWGKQGYTFIDLKKVRKKVFRDALTTSYCLVAPSRLSRQVRAE
jgi:predicted DNA-binding protein (MmcQ/YjbR family)